jgi:hypothetical protein
MPIISATASLNSRVFETGSLVRMETLTGVASLDVSLSFLVWRTKKDSVHTRGDRAPFPTLAAHLLGPQFIPPEIS